MPHALVALPVSEFPLWFADVKETQGAGATVAFPVVPDDTGAVVTDTLGWPAPSVATTTAIVDVAKRVRFKTTYPPVLGRNFYEVLRCLDALQVHTHAHVSTPAHWTFGDPVYVLPTLSTDAMARHHDVASVKRVPAAPGQPPERKVPMPDVSTHPSLRAQPS